MGVKQQALTVGESRKNRGNRISEKTPQVKNHHSPNTIGERCRGQPRTMVGKNPWCPQRSTVVGGVFQIFPRGILTRFIIPTRGTRAEPHYTANRVRVHLLETRARRNKWKKIRTQLDFETQGYVNDIHVCHRGDGCATLPPPRHWAFFFFFSFFLF